MTSSAHAADALRASDVPIENLFYLICYAFDAPPSALSTPVGAESANHPVQLIAETLFIQVERLLKRGLERDYLEERADIAGIRGRVDFSQTLRRQLLVHGKTACVFTSFEADTPQNQVLATTLERLSRSRALPLAQRRTAANLRIRVPARTAFEWRIGAFDRVPVPARNPAVAFCLRLCKLLVDDALPYEVGETSRFSDYSGDSRWLGGVFERFVLRFWQREAPWLNAGGQRNRHWHALHGPDGDHAYLPMLLTDIELNTPSGRVLVETKCYRKPLGGSRNASKLNPSHVNQLFAYLVNTELSGEPVAGGMLLYAQVTEPIVVNLHWKGLPVQVRSVDLSQGWKRTRDQLLEIARAWASMTQPVAEPDGAAHG